MIKKLLFLVALLAGLGAYSQDFEVNMYNVDLKVSQEGYFDVIEDYAITFNRQRRGIYRDILLKYDFVDEHGEKSKREIEISNIEVPGHKTKITGKFGRRMSGNLNIRIGDPNVYISGPMDYSIRYRVKNAFLHNQDGVQLYWNLKPSDWNTTFQDMQFRIELPEGVEVSEDEVFIYSGYVGTTEASDKFRVDVADGIITAKALPDFASYYGQAVTVLVKMPEGAVAEITPAWPFWTNYGWTLIIGLFVAGFYGLWRKYGKDDRVPTAISYYPPEGIDPAMAGFLIDDKQDTRDLISLIPYWGHKGYIRINEIDKKGLFAKDDTQIVKLKNIAGNAPLYERKLFNGIFSGGETKVMVSSLRNSFYSTMNTCKKHLKESAQKYYEPKSKKVQVWVTVGLILLTLLTLPVVLYFWGVLPAIGLVIANIVLLVLNFYMIKKNTDGNAIFSELKGFKKFIKTAEENKLEFLIKDRPNYFESTMAYALTFGALSSWSRKFEKLDVNPPDWYNSSSGSIHSMNSFSNSFSKTISSTSSTMVSTPSSSGSGGSSGGGFSGGGFGGGGGGSW